MKKLYLDIDGVLFGRIFDYVAKGLMGIASFLRLTYNEINIIVYYLIVPMSWCVLADVVIGMPILTPLWMLLWIYVYVTRRNRFSQWCDEVFRKSVDFLLWFKRIGWNYWKASVIICVVVPFIVYVLLFLALLV